MSGREYFILGSSFCMGLFAGAFLYVTVYAPAYTDEGIDFTGGVDGAMVIEGQMYGGCQEMESCASFKLVDDRTYHYLQDGEGDVENGRLPSDLSKRIFSFVRTQELEAASQAITQDSCDAFVDGVDYTYTVTFEDKLYSLDTCTTALAYNDALQILLLDAWSFMENPTTTYPTIIEQGVGGVFKERFQNAGEE